MRAIQITEFGGPEVLMLTELPDPQAGPGQLLIEVSHAGVNYADTHQAENTYLGGAHPGRAAGGGSRQRRIRGEGRRPTRGPSTYPTTWTTPPRSVSSSRGRRRGCCCVHLLAGESVVVHAAAGGVGSLAVQLAKLAGAGRVIATASTEEKRRLALDLGADVAVDPSEPDLRAALRDANDGRRVDVVLEMTGGRVTDESLAALAPFGRLAYYGMASRRPPKPVQLGVLLSHSATVAGMWAPHAFGLPTQLFSLVEEGRLRVITGGGLRPVRGQAGARGAAGPPDDREADARPDPVTQLGLNKP